MKNIDLKSYTLEELENLIINEYLHSYLEIQKYCSNFVITLKN